MSFICIYQGSTHSNTQPLKTSQPLTHKTFQLETYWGCFHTYMVQSVGSFPHLLWLVWLESGLKFSTQLEPAIQECGLTRHQPLCLESEPDQSPMTWWPNPIIGSSGFSDPQIWRPTLIESYYWVLGFIGDVVLILRNASTNSVSGMRRGYQPSPQQPHLCVTVQITIQLTAIHRYFVTSLCFCCRL